EWLPGPPLRIDGLSLQADCRLVDVEKCLEPGLALANGRQECVGDLGGTHLTGGLERDQLGRGLLDHDAILQERILLVSGVNGCQRPRERRSSRRCAGERWRALRRRKATESECPRGTRSGSARDARAARRPRCSVAEAGPRNRGWRRVAAATAPSRRRRIRAVRASPPSSFLPGKATWPARLDLDGGE